MTKEADPVGNRSSTEVSRPFFTKGRRASADRVCASNKEERSNTSATMGGHHVNAEAEPRDDQDVEAMKKAMIPLGYRDTCGHLLIKLNSCRRNTFYLPHECSHERHTYEECQYYAYLQRVEAKSLLKIAAAKKRAELAEDED